ncbi:MAG: aldehyde ferredoxin oxidoreductase C-terminal domain-containing protein, partial [Candidatus Bathyarchaeia archaeon]
IWGMDTYETTRFLRDLYGRGTRVISIGQAGENLSRIAIIQTETENAAGQGGFGGVMGSKRLKAIAVMGTGGVKIARPSEFLGLCLGQSREGLEPCKPDSNPRWPSDKTLYGDQSIDLTRFRSHKCGFCSSVCTEKLWMDIPGEVTSERYTTACLCYGFDLPLNAHVETRALASKYGINGWEVSYGIIPWLQLCKQNGLISDIDGVEIPAPEKPIEYLRDCAKCSADLIVMLLRKIAFREGPIGDALSEGACYAADRLFGGKGKPLLDRIYPRRCGQVEHWAGHWGPGGEVHYPLWLPTLLQWCMDTRDPASDTSHSWAPHVIRYISKNGPYPLEKTRAVSEKVYGNPDVCDPAFEYDPPETKAIPAIWHTDRGMVVDSLVLCDWEHPRVFSMFSEDGAADTALMAKLFSACTGVEMSEDGLQKSGERIFNLLRAIDIRNHRRDRREDERTIESFMYPGKDDEVMLDRTRFLKLMDKYYELRGWNKINGWPTRARLEALGLKNVADKLESIGKIG